MMIALLGTSAIAACGGKTQPAFYRYGENITGYANSSFATNSNSWDSGECTDLTRQLIRSSYGETG